MSECGALQAKCAKLAAQRAQFKSKMEAVNVNVTDINWRSVVNRVYSTYLAPFIPGSGACTQAILSPASTACSILLLLI
jgi:hypothetical protein